MAGPALLFAATTASLDLLSGYFGYRAAQQQAAAELSRSRFLRMEADAQATRYAETSRRAIAKTKLSYLKSGVDVAGSVLDVLDEDILTAQENISAMRASGAMSEADGAARATALRNEGRAALLRGIIGGGVGFTRAAFRSGATQDSAAYNRKALGEIG